MDKQDPRLVLEKLGAAIAAEYAKHPEALECSTLTWPTHYPRLCKLIEAHGNAQGWLTHANPRRSFEDSMGYRMDTVRGLVA